MIKINLLPYHETEKKEDLKRQIIIIAGASVIFFLVLASFHIYLGSSISTMEGKIKDGEDRLVVLNKKLGDIEVFKKQKKEAEQKLAVIKGLEENRFFAVRIMDELAMLVPAKDVWLVKVTEKGPEILIEGVARDNAVVSRFMKNLVMSSFISSVELTYTKEKEVSGFKLQQFALSCVLKKG
jgi:Tfp pilus assembly protein PilN